MQGLLVNTIHSTCNNHYKIKYNSVEMYVEALSLLDFRNYASLELSLSPSLNVIYGANAQGKSAVLEAIYVLATSKSHRSSRDLELIRIGADCCRIAARVVRPKSSNVDVEVVVSRTEKKQVKINTVRHNRIADIVGNLNAVVFSALDIEMIRGEPSLRRRFLNLDISQVSPQYVFALGRYKRALEQRNKLLKEVRVGNSHITCLEVWDRQLAEYGASLILRRKSFCSALAEEAAERYRFLTDSKEMLDLKYVSSVDEEPACSEMELAERILKMLRARWQADIARGATSIGPHRDDLQLTISGMDAAHYASQGQQKTAALAVKLAEIKLLESIVGEPPVVLLDDAGAELDEERRKRMVESVQGNCQTVITTTKPEELGPGLVSSAALYQVVAGRVSRH